ncbi:hypothetical protein D3C85_801120 [compost metagenome]
MIDYYDGDLTPADSLVTLEEADTILAATLHGREWTARANDDRRACGDDPDRTPARNLDRAALMDASAVLAAQDWKGRKAASDQAQSFPRTGLNMGDGRVIQGVPVEVKKAASMLAAHLIARSEQSMTPEVFRAYQIGEVRGEFRAPIRDDLPRHVRLLVQPLLESGSGWAPVRA